MMLESAAARFRVDFSRTRKGGSAVWDKWNEVHKAYIDVTETGTEAAAATGIGVALVAMVRPAEVPVFRADHPFVFQIRDTRTGLVLFTGRLMDPKR